MCIWEFELASVCLGADSQKQTRRHTEAELLHRQGSIQGEKTERKRKIAGPNQRSVVPGGAEVRGIVNLLTFEG
jgi:hypothetical protein